MFKNRNLSVILTFLICCLSARQLTFCLRSRLTTDYSLTGRSMSVGWDNTSANGNNLEFEGPINCVNSLDGRAISLDNTQVGVDYTDPEVICAAIGCGDYAGLSARDAAESLRSATANAAATQAAWDAHQIYLSTVSDNLAIAETIYQHPKRYLTLVLVEYEVASNSVLAAQAAYDTAQAAYNADPSEANETARDEAENASPMRRLRSLNSKHFWHKPSRTPRARCRLAAAQAEYNAAQQESSNYKPI